MATATRVPETYRLGAGHAARTLRHTGWRALALDSFARFRAADGFTHARSLAYQVTLTSIPALLALVGFATAAGGAQLRMVLRRTLLGLAPGPAGETLSTAFRQGTESGATALWIGLVVALASGTAAMAQVERGANRIYGMESDRAPLRRYLVALALSCSAGVLAVVAFLVLVAGAALGDAARAAGTWSNDLATAWSLARWPVAILLAVPAFALLFQRAPRRTQPGAGWLAVGSAATVVLWLLLTGALALYLAASSSFATYGSLAGLIGLMLWAFSSSVALFLGIAISAQLEAVRAEHGAPTEG